MVNGIRVKDRLEGASNFVSWKIRIITILQELELDSYIDRDIKMPEYEPDKTSWKRRNKEARKLSLTLSKIIFFHPYRN